MYLLYYVTLRSLNILIRKIVINEKFIKGPHTITSCLQAENLKYFHYQYFLIERSKSIEIVYQLLYLR